MSRGGHQSIQQIRGWGGVVTATQGHILQPGHQAESSGNSGCFIAWGNASVPMCAKNGSVAKARVFYCTTITFHI